MAKKYFYNKVHNTRKTVINIIIIGVCIIGVIICFLIVTNLDVKSNEKQNTYYLKPGVTIEVNEKYTNEIFLSKIEDNVDLDLIEVKYPSNFDITTPGNYDLILTINKKNYDMPMTIVDTTKPELVLKAHTIKDTESYSAKDFVTSCSDNSTKECNITFASGLDEDGNVLDYSSYKEAGTYSIKILATDESGNQNIQETALTIEGTTSKPPVDPEPEQPTVCKYGNGEYDTNEYILTSNITTNGCAISLDLYKDEKTMSELTQIMNSETIKVQKEIENLNLTGTLALSRKINVVLNTSSSGIVGYELIMTVTLTDTNNNVEKITEYKLNNDGSRVYLVNTYNLK